MKSTNHAPNELDHNALVIGASAGQEMQRPRTKKEQILALYESGATDIAQIVRQLSVRPSYVGDVLHRAGLIQGYNDLFTSNSDPNSGQNLYARFFRGVLQYKTVESAAESVRQIDRLYNYFERLRDPAGRHHAMLIAMIGMNRARWSGKRKQAEIFSHWLIRHC